MTSDSIDPAIEAARREHPQLDAPFAGVFSRLRRLVEIDEDALVRLYAGFSVRPAEVALLHTLRRAGAPYELTPGELARQLLRSSTAMTARIDRLADLGLVERIPDPADRRTILVRLTDQGCTIQDDAIRSLVEYRAGLFEDLSPSQIDQLLSSLRVLLLRLEQIPRD